MKHDPRVYANELPGRYAVKLAKASVEVACEVTHGPLFDPDTGEEMDRGLRWTVTIDGKPVWEAMPSPYPHLLLGRPIDDATYDWLIAHRAHMRRYHPHSPEANPRKPVDLSAVTPLF